MVVTLLTLLLTWGVLAFGAVYPWASGPMAAAIVVLAAWQWRPRRPWGAVAWAGLAVCAAIGVQLVPVSTSVLGAVSPAAGQFLSALDVAYANGTALRHPVSIDPGRTLRAIGFLALGFVWVPTCAAVLARPSALRVLARNVAIVGTAVAVIGLAQKATFNGKLLWFWTPQFFASNGFGPFVNRNHFAGWMLLALTLSVGLLFGHLNRSGPAPGSDWRRRILWTGSRAASPVLLVSAAALVMACSLVWTMSRSGIVAAGAALTVLLVAAVSRSKGSTRKWVLAGYLTLTVTGVVAWRGADTLFDWYGNTGTLQWRIQLWKDTVPALEQFWLTGSGLNTYRTVMLVQPRTDLTVQPREAHNDYLQLAVEGGVLVTIPALMLLLTLAWEIVRALKRPQDEMTWWIRIGAVAGVCGIAVQEISEFSLQIPGVALLFGTCLAIALHQAAPSQSRHHSRPAGDGEWSTLTAA